MAWDVPAIVTNLPGLVYGVLAVAIAAFVLAANPRATPNRSFAVMMGLLGLRFILTNGWYVLFGRTEFTQLMSNRTGNGLQVASALAVIHFFSVYPTRRDWTLSRLAVGALAVAGAGVAVLQFARPDLFSYGWSMSATGSVVGAHNGPLLAVPPTSTAWALGALLAFLAYRRAPAGPTRDALLLLTVGFGGASMQSRASALEDVVSGTVFAADPRIWDITNRVAGFVCLALTLAVIVGLFLDRRDSRARSRMAAWVLLCIGAAAWLLSFALNAYEGASPQGVAILTARAALNLALPIFAGYAILEHQLLDIDLKVKWTIRRGTLAGIFVAVFIVVTQVAQNYLSDEYGVVIGGVMAALLVFALSPLQRVADRVANAAMPGVDASATSRDHQRQSVYRSAVAMALQDRVVTRDEERTLASLAAELGIDARRALQLREEVERELGVAG